MHDLRISLTDRCNFRCTYCMPKEVFDHTHRYLPQESVLSFEEIARLARVFVARGVEKLRLTGGEPLLRRGMESLIEMLSDLRTPAGAPVELTLTSNGSLLKKKAAELKAAGLDRLNVSLDALDETVFRRVNDVDFPASEVLEGIDAALTAGFSDIKINMVVRRGVNDGEILPMARYFKARGQTLRFIEFMDTGNTNGWRLDEVVPSAEVLRRIGEAIPIEALSPNYIGEVADRWRYRDGSAEIGVISSVTQAFCSTCTRARLSPDGKLYLCLFAERGYDLRELLRSGASDVELDQAVTAIWGARTDNYSETRTSQTQGLNKVEMSYIGG